MIGFMVTKRLQLTWK